MMRKRIGFLGAALLVAVLALSLGGCEALLGMLGGVSDWLSAPYGYVQDANGVGVVGATVKIYKDSVTEANLVQSSATTGTDGMFSLSNKVDTKGGLYVVVVTAPSGTSLLFDNVTVKVPTTGYLFNIGTIKPKGGVYTMSGNVVNVRQEPGVTQDIPTSGTVEIRTFGATTASYTANVTASGTFSVGGVASGNYLVTYKGIGTTWIGIPASVGISGGNLTNVGALVYKTTGITNNSILLVLEWKNPNYDIDSTSMVGAVGSAIKVDYTNKIGTGLPTGNAVTLERDVIVSSISLGAYPAETTLVTSLASGTELRFYAKAFATSYPTTTTSVTGLDDGLNSINPAGVRLYAMYNTISSGVTTGTHYGTWNAPLNTSEVLVGMASIYGNANGSMTIGSFNFNNTSSSTPRALSPVFEEGVFVSEIK